MESITCSKKTITTSGKFQIINGIIMVLNFLVNNFFLSRYSFEENNKYPDIATRSGTAALKKACEKKAFRVSDTVKLKSAISGIHGGICVTTIPIISSSLAIAILRLMSGSMDIYV